MKKKPRKGTRSVLADPVAAEIMEAMLQQLVILLVERLGGNVIVPVSEVDTATIGKMLSMKVIDQPGGQAFQFRVYSREGN